MGFKVESKVYYNGVLAEVQFGPVKSGSSDAYLVKYLDGGKTGSSSLVGGHLLEQAPKFEVSQVVRAPHLTDGLAKVAAGPFRGERTPWYVLELPGGVHYREVEEDIDPVVE